MKANAIINVIDSEGGALKSPLFTLLNAMRNLFFSVRAPSASFCVLSI